MNNRRKLTSNSGITLIALIITIIILLILAGVSISMVIGNNGIITQGQAAKVKQEISEYIDRIELARGEATVENLGSVNLEQLITKIRNKNEAEQWGISDISYKTGDTEAEVTTREGYVIVITAQDAKFDRTTSEIKIPELTDGDLVINKPEWDASTHKASVTIEKSSNLSEQLEVQYQINATNDDGWITGKTVSNLNHGDVVNVRLWNGSSGGERYTTLTVKDSIAPTVTVTVTGTGTNSLIASVTATDSEYGMETNPTYTWYIKKTSEADTEYVQKQSSTSATYNFTGLAQTTNYTVKVEVKDKAQNTGSGTDSGTTGTVQVAEGNITINLPTWNASTNKASTTIVKGTGIDSALEVQYQVNGIADAGWITGTSVENLSHGDVVNARLWDGNNGGGYTTLTVKDSIAPNVNVSITSSGTNWITASVSASDSQYGMETNPTYTWYIKKTSQGDSAYIKQNTTGTTCNFSGLEQKTEYTVKAEVKDKAQNIGAGTTKITTGTVIIAEGNIKIDNLTWSSNKASVTISKETNIDSSLQVQYQVNGTNDNGWITGTNVENLTHGDVVNARLWDGNNGGSYTTLTVKDSIAPTVNVSITSTGTNTLTASASSSDSQYGMPATPTYTWYIKKETESDSAYVKQSSTSSTCNFTGLVQTTSYVVKVEVKDKAQNTGSQTATKKTGTVQVAEGNISINNLTWSSNKASVTISKGSGVSSSLNIQYQVNGTNDNAWITGTSVTGLNHGDVVNARLWDGNNGGSYTTLTVKDTTAPTVTVSITSTGTNTISAKVTASDSQWGMPTSPSYTWYIKKTSQGDSSYVKQSSTGTTCSFSGLSSSTSYTVKAEVKDKAQNTGVGTKTGSTTAPASYTLSYNANGGTGVPASSNYTSGSTVSVNFTTVPVKEGLTFKGWSTSSTATTPTYTSSGTKQFTITSNTTLYAVWENPYANIFEFESSTGTITGIKMNDNIMKPSNSTIYYYEYYESPWNSSTSYMNRYGGCVLNNDIDTLVVPSRINGVAVKNVKYLGAINVRKLIFEEGIQNIQGCYRLSNSEYSYNGFYMSSTQQSYYKLEEIVIPTSVTTIGQEAFMLYEPLVKVNYKGTSSQWNSINMGYYNNHLTDATRVYGDEQTTSKYTLSYNANGGTGVPTSAQYASGSLVSVNFTTIPVKEGLTFKGWSTSSTATTPTYTSSGTKQFTITSNVTLYAVWENPYANIFEFESSTGTITGIKMNANIMKPSDSTIYYYEYYESPWNSSTSYMSKYGGCVLKNNIDTLVVPSRINGVAVKNVKYLGAINVRKLIFEEGIQNIQGCYRLSNSEYSYNGFYMSSTQQSYYKLEEIVIPTSVTTIGQEAFMLYEPLVKVNYKGTSSQWNSINIGNYNNHLTEATRVYGYGN